MWNNVEQCQLWYKHQKRCRKEAEGQVSTEEVPFCADSSLLKSGHPSGFGSLLIPGWQTSGALLPAHLDQRDHGTFEHKGVIRTSVALFCRIL